MLNEFFFSKMIFGDDFDKEAIYKEIDRFKLIYLF